MEYKSEGVVLQPNDICQKGYTYQIFIFTDPVQKKNDLKDIANLC